MVDERLDALRPLRQLLAGGDVLSRPHVERALRELPGCRLINGYGPTENTTFTCCYTISSNDLVSTNDLGAPAELGLGDVSIGAPIARIEAHILDNAMQPLRGTLVPIPVESATNPLPAKLAAAILAILSDLSGEDLSKADAGTTFLELGFDSLFLSQVAQ